MKAYEVTTACLQGRGPRKQVQRWILVAVAHAGPFDDVEAWRQVTIDYAASQTGCNRDTIKKWLPALVEDGWLTARRMGRGRPTLYSVNAAQLGPNFTHETSPTKLHPPEHKGSPAFEKLPPNGGPNFTHKVAQTSPIYRVVQSSSKEERDAAPVSQPADTFNPPGWQAPVQAILFEHFGAEFRLVDQVLDWVRDGHKILPDDINDRSALFVAELTARVENKDFGPRPDWVLKDGVKRWARLKAIEQRSPTGRAYLPAPPESKPYNPDDYATPAKVDARGSRDNPLSAAFKKVMND